MSQSHMAFLLDHLYRAAPRPAGDAVTDADLLTRNVAERDEAAFCGLGAPAPPDGVGATDSTRQGES
jgi:hypothetical protein